MFKFGRVWFVDFDQFTLTGHSYFDKSLIGYEISKNGERVSKAEDWLQGNVRNLKWYKEFFEARKAEGDLICIVTKHPDRAHIKCYMAAIFGEEWRRVIDFIYCNFGVVRKPAQGLKRKNLDMYAVLVILGFTHIYKKNKARFILLDDDQSNTNAAKAHGFSVVEAPVDDNSYMEKAEKINEETKAYKLTDIKEMQKADKQIFDQCAGHIKKCNVEDVREILRKYVFVEADYGKLLLRAGWKNEKSQNLTEYEQIRRREIIDLLLGKGADINTTNSNQQNLVGFCKQNGKEILLPYVQNQLSEDNRAEHLIEQITSKLQVPPSRNDKRERAVDDEDSSDDDIEQVLRSVPRFD